MVLRKDLADIVTPRGIIDGIELIVRVVPGALLTSDALLVSIYLLILLSGVLILLLNTLIHFEVVKSRNDLMMKIERLRSFEREVREVKEFGNERQLHGGVVVAPALDAGQVQGCSGQ